MHNNILHSSKNLNWKVFILVVILQEPQMDRNENKTTYKKYERTNERISRQL